MDPIRQLNLPLHSRVLIAVSGGPDSVALALAFHAVARESRSGWSLRLGHVNHGLRGDETAEDEAFVSELARELELPLDVSHVDTAAYAGQHHLSLETAARDQRYAALGTMLAAWPGELLATAHTRDDQAATVLLHLARGAGLHGLTGIWPERGGLIRPFLSLPRATILASLDAARQPYRLDSSNMDPRHSRNRVEHELMPLIDAIQPGASAAVARSAASLTADRDYLDLEAEELDRTLDVRQDALGVSASAGAFRVLHPAMQRIVLRRLIGRAVGELHDVEYEHVELMREAILAGESAARLLDQLPRGLGLTVNRAQFYIGTSGAEEILVIEPTTLSVPGSVKLTSGVLECEILSDLDHSERSRLLAVC
ncbi:MAG TPA: tRNA lysidine(34) synthetase TilS, partial [Chloroflexota bacterium]